MHSPPAAASLVRPFGVISKFHPSKATLTPKAVVVARAAAMLEAARDRTACKEEGELSDEESGECSGSEGEAPDEGQGADPGEAADWDPDVAAGFQ